MTTYYAEIAPTASKLPDWSNYLLIFLFFTTIIILVFVIIAFAKWLTWGPSWKRKWNNFLSKFSGKKPQDGVIVKGKEIIVDENYITEIEQKIDQAKTPQELLEFQIIKENHEKQKLKAETEIIERENEKIEKLEAKENKKVLKENAKKVKKDLKEKEKETKQKLKDQKEKNKKEGKL